MGVKALLESVTQLKVRLISKELMQKELILLKMDVILQVSSQVWALAARLTELTS